MATRRLWNELKVLKLKEVPSHVKPMLSMNFVKNFVNEGVDNYIQKYIQTSSIQPLYHVCFGGMIFSYLVALPEERRRHAHEEEEHARKELEAAVAAAIQH